MSEPLYIPVELQALRKRLQLQIERKKRVRIILKSKKSGLLPMLKSLFGIG